MASRVISLPYLLVLLATRARVAQGRRAGGPSGEGPLARTLRWAADRRRLAELDERLLADVGLTRADLAQGVPFGMRAPRRTPRSVRLPERVVRLVQDGAR